MTIYVKNLEHKNIVAFCNDSCKMANSLLTNTEYSNHVGYHPADDPFVSCVHCAWCNSLLITLKSCILCNGYNCSHNPEDSMAFTAYEVYIKDLHSIDLRNLPIKDFQKFTKEYWIMIKMFQFERVTLFASQAGIIPKI